jgi:HEAT repeat protein
LNTQPKISVQDLLHHLAANKELPSLQELSALSDLSRQDLRVVQGAWHEIPEERRVYVIRSLVEDAKQNIHLQLGRLLRLGLTDANSEIRQLAIEGLWEEITEDLIGPFVQMLLNDSEAAVREAAAKALGPFILAGELDEIDTSLSIRAEEALLSVLQNEMEALAVQCRALESIAFSSEAGIRQIIEDAYYSPYEDMQVSALNAMGRSADIRWRSLVQAELQNPSAAMRAAAARACGELEVQAAQQELLELLLDDSQEVRLGVIFALGRLGGEQAVEALNVVVNSGDELESEAAALALEEMLFYADTSAVPLFDESVAESDEWDQDIWDSAWDGEL